MKKSEFHGWFEVARFTLAETWKNRSFLIFMIIMWVVCMLAIPVMSVINSSGKSGEADEEYKFENIQLEKVYVLDELQLTAMGFDVSSFKKAGAFKDVTIDSVHNKTYDEMREQVEKEPCSAMLHIYVDGVHGICFDVVRAIESKVAEKECDYIGSVLTKEFDTFKYAASGMGEEQMKALACDYNVVALLEQENGEFVTERAHLSEANYWVVYALLFAIMMICTTSSSQVATAVAMDKSTKVMEYLLTSVRPMALVFGKVVAQVVSSVLQLGVSLVLALLSNFVTAQITGENFIRTKLPANLFENITIPNIVLSMIVIALGVMLYGFIAGLCGAMVRKMEELQEGMSLLIVFTIVGAYLAMFASMAMQSSLTTPLFYVAMIVPLSSPFLLPGVCLVGVGAWWLKLCSLALLLVLDVIILFASARIYEALILYNGSTIKPKQLIKFLKQAKGGKTV